MYYALLFSYLLLAQWASSPIMDINMEMWQNWLPLSMLTKTFVDKMDLLDIDSYI